MSFVPLEATDHTINITFNKDVVPGAPFVAKIHTGTSKLFNNFEIAKPTAPLFSDPNRILVSGQSLAATAVGKKSSFTLSNVTGSAHDIDIVIDSPNGEAIPSEIVDSGNGNATKYRFLLSSLLLFLLSVRLVQRRVHPGDGGRAPDLPVLRLGADPGVAVRVQGVQRGGHPSEGVREGDRGQARDLPRRDVEGRAGKSGGHRYESSEWKELFGVSRSLI